MSLTWNEVDLDLAVFERFCSILDSTCPKALIVYHRRHLKDFINSRTSLILCIFYIRNIILMRKEIKNEPVGQDAKEVRGPVK